MADQRAPGCLFPFNPDPTARCEQSSRRAALAAVLDGWVHTPALVELAVAYGARADLLAYAASPTGVARTLARYGHQAPNGEPTGLGPHPDLVRAAAQRSALVLLALEEYAQAAWDFRAGVPELVTRGLAAHGLAPASEQDLLLADPMRAEGDVALLAAYLGEAAAGAASGRAGAPELEAALSDAFRDVPGVAPDGATLCEWLTGPSTARYRERAQAARFPIPDAHVARVRGLASTLGLIVPTRPGLADPHVVVVLGAGGLEPLRRVAYAAELLAGRVNGPEVWLLGSARPLMAHERADADTYAAGAADEFALMASAARATFEIQDEVLEYACGCTAGTGPCPTWHARLGREAGGAGATPVTFQHDRVLHLRTRTGSGVHVLSAATSDPDRRANTADTFRLLAACARLGPETAVLAVTTQIYVPFQGFDALRMLSWPHGVALDVAGHGGGPSASERAEPVLQELLSAIRSARRLAVTLAGP